ncbi:MAG: tetratricopeptide repeat protein [Gallionella sp.]|nr:tetratricopeptide repeat protein [Gallionella sp.]
MTERENLPTVIATQAMAVLTEQRESLVGRGLVALKKDNDALYRQARVVFHRKNNTSSWDETDDPTLFSAFKTFQKLSAENFGKAYWPLSILYHEKRDIKGDQNPTQHYAQLAFDWCYENRANQDVELWRDLGNMFRSGWGVEQNDGEAVYWYHKAAEQGDSGGQFNLGVMYEDGCGVEQNPELAVYWYRKAAEQGDTAAQFNLGVIYSEGQGVRQDYEEAVKWYRLAADQGDADAQSNLGAMYCKGEGVPQDYDEAVKWFREAADQGDAVGQFNLGAMYDNGTGVPRKKAQAITWYQLAAAQGHAEAQNLLKLHDEETQTFTKKL